MSRPPVPYYRETGNEYGLEAGWYYCDGNDEHGPYPSEVAAYDAMPSEDEFDPSEEEPEPPRHAGPRRLNPAEQRKRDGESALNYEDWKELSAPVEHPGDSWMGNEDI